MGHDRFAVARRRDVPFGRATLQALRPVGAAAPQALASDPRAGRGVGHGEARGSRPDRRLVRDRAERRRRGRFTNAQPADLGEGPKLLFVGRLDERKGFPTAVRAFAQLASDRPDLRLVVVGDGPERSAVDSLTPEVRARVTMLGAVANVDLHPYEIACDLYLGSAVGGESFGVVLVEAMAAGLPIVASDIPGYDEVVSDGIEGMLVPPRDAAAAARAAATILDDADLAGRMSRAGRARARTFDWSVVGARLVDLYGRAIALGPLR